MMMLSQSGSLRLDTHNGSASNHPKATIDLPAHLTAQQNDLFDRVFAFAFDVLGLQAVQLRPRPADQGASQTPTVYPAFSSNSSSCAQRAKGSKSCALITVTVPRASAPAASRHHGSATISPFLMMRAM